MKTRWFKNTITYLFLALFFTMKMAGFHALSHTNDDDHGVDCAICIHVNTTNLTPALSPDFEYSPIEYVEFTIKTEVINSYSFVASNAIASNQLFSRPPPSLL